jgi:O-antigen/teichoic acid export membrane protein
VTLRQQVLRGGGFLAVRQGLGMVIGLVGVVTLTRLIGPSNYGRFAAAVGLFTYVQSLATWGINIYLIRNRPEEREDVYHQAFTLLLLLGIAAGLIVFALLPRLEVWTRLPGLEDAARPIVFTLPLALTAQVALARLERALKYREVAVIELSGQLVYYSVTLPLALAGFVSAAPFAGWIVQQLIAGSMYFVVGAYRPRLRWNMNDVNEILRYGLSYSASSWVWQIRTLVNPLVVGRFAGLEAVGVVAITIRLVEYLTFIKAAAWRMSLAALGRMQGDLERLRSAISAGMLLQILAVGPILLVFSWAAPWVLPRLFGSAWTATLQLFPFVALSYLANSMFNLHSSALYALQRNWEVTSFHVVHILLFVSSSVILVPRIGMMGYGFAELCGLGAYAVAHRQVARHIGTVEYGIALAWGLAIALALFHAQLGLASTVGLIAAIGFPKTRGAVISVIRQLDAAYRGK